MNGLRVPQPIEVLHSGQVALACGLDGQLQAEELHGLFAADTRMLSTYRIGIGGHSWRLLGRSRSGRARANWQFENLALRDPDGELAAGTLLLSLRRQLSGALHDDLRVRAFVQRPARVQLVVQLDADFADIFQVKEGSLPPRLDTRRVAQGRAEVLSYERAGFRRALHITFDAPDPRPTFVGALVLFDLELAPGAEWACCLEVVPEIDGEALSFAGDPHAPESSPTPETEGVTIHTEPILEYPFRRGRADLRALAVPQSGHPSYVAAGVPWFLTLFGRDSLVTALMAGLDGAWYAEGALAALAPLQASARDDWRDAEPGKLPHEVRRGELAFRGLIPQTPYYGTHDAPALYCLVLWHAWRWTGDRGLLDAHLPVANAALRWCDELGDRDADGFQEYATRSPRGYYNQSWKDAGDAIVHADGSIAALPLATIELQGYLFAAYLAMAELQAEHGDLAEAERLRASARALRARVEDRFWLPKDDFYAQALDGDKHSVACVSSNPGHLLWCGLPSPTHAAKVAQRILEPDMFTGWGLRTLSSRNPAYNPLVYQRGSVWPHDTALAAAGLWRYGLREGASTLLRAMLEAASVFEEDRLPELFCGLDRSHGLPVPYAGANSPQAWAAAAPVLAAQLFLGIVPDAPRERCFLAPWLPDWLSRLEVRGITVGRGTLDVSVIKQGRETVIERLEAHAIEIVRGTAEAALWGEPPEATAAG